MRLPDHDRTEAVATLLLGFLVAFLVWRRFQAHRGMFEREWLVVGAYWLVLFAGLILAILLGMLSRLGR